MTRGERAEENFRKGYNCTQSVLYAFSDILKDENIIKCTSCFGGGMGRLREVCGSVSAAFIICSHYYGYTNPSEKDKKDFLYSKIQLLSSRFEEELGTIICRELLKLNRKKDEPISEERTSEYYEKRPCANICKVSASIIEAFLKEEGLI